MATTPVFGWITPDGTSAGDVPYWMNQLALYVENELVARDSAWTAFTTTVGGTAAPTVVARYKQMGKTVFYRIEITLTAAVTAAMTFTLPVARFVQGSEPSYGQIYAKDVSAGLYINGQAILVSGTSCRIMLAASGTNSNLTDASATVPFTWASGDTISIRGEYEAA